MSWKENQDRFTNELSMMSWGHARRENDLLQSIWEGETELSKCKKVMETEMKVQIENLSHKLEQERAKYENEITMLIKSKNSAQEDWDAKLETARQKAAADKLEMSAWNTTNLWK